ncbi:hypothetical protein DRP53_05820 [candidate division WOR-3 bacterium]|uniref:Uncharacterized protein n=1 Tax=candidate division WOR-3 bacterium TaxID=2052148 RepID=A0A660SHQ2_UNCW3|nr:MAG: hypothetical protein DRP53_05820 [candidate division WOR-3 bacterium]
MKRVGCIILVVILCLLLGGYLLIRSYLNEARLTSFTKDFLTRSFQRPCEVKRVSLRFGLGIRISIDDIRVPKLLEVENVSLRLSLLPLLLRKIVINKTEINKPRMEIVRRADGSMNLPPLPTGKVEGEGFLIDLREVSIRDGILGLSDEKARRTVLIQNLDQDLHGTNEGFTLSGSGRVLYKEEKLKEPLSVKFANQLRVDTVSKSVFVSDTKISIGNADLLLSGDLSPNRLNLTLNGRRLEVGELVRLIPSEKRRGFDLDGNIDFDLEVKGKPKNPHLRFAAAGQSIKLKGMAIPELAEIDLDVNGTEERVDIRNLTIRRRSSRFNITGAYFVKRGTFDIKGSGKVFGPDLEPLLSGMRGTIDLKMDVSGTAQKPVYEIDVRMSDGAYQELSNIDLAAKLRPDTAKISRLSFRMKRSDFNLSGRVVNFKSPTANLSLRSKFIDLDGLQSKKKGETKQPLPKINGRLSFQIDHLKVQNNDLYRVKGAARYQNERLKIEQVSFRAYDGSGQGKGEIRLSERPPFNFEVRARDLSAQKLFRRLFGIDNISGRFRARIKSDGIGFDTDDIKRNLNCDGYVSLINGEFRNFGFTNKLLEWLKITEGGRFKYKDINATIKIRKGRVRFDDVLVQTRSADYLLFGTLGFDGRIDYRITVTFDQRTSKRLKRLHADWIFYTDSKGRIIVDIFAKGTLDHPRFSLDKKRIRERLRKKVKKNWDRQKKEIIKKIKGLFG